MDSVQSASSAKIRRMARRSAAGLSADTVDGEERRAVNSLSTTSVGDLLGDL